MVVALVFDGVRKGSPVREAYVRAASWIFRLSPTSILPMAQESHSV